MSHTHRPLIHRPRIRRRPLPSRRMRLRQIREIDDAISRCDLCLGIHMVAVAAPRDASDVRQTASELAFAWQRLKTLLDV